MKPYGWRAFATRDGDLFIRDEVKVFIAHRTNEGHHPVEPINLIKFGELIPEGALIPDGIQPTIWPMDFCEVIYGALSAVVVGVDDPAAEIRRLRSALATSEARVDKLIAGIGRLGGEQE